MQSTLERLTRSLPVWLFALTAVWCVALYQPRTAPISFDNQTFFYIAERAASGVPPHVSVVNHKHALSHLLSGAAIFAGRLAGVDDVMAARALSIVACAALVALTGVLTRDLTRRSDAAALAGLATLLYSPLLRQAAMGFRPHLFAALFLVAALVTYTRRRDVMAGALATAAFLCWQPAVAVAMAVAAASLGERDGRIRSLAALAAGSLLVVLPYEAYFFAKDAVGEQLFQTWTMASYGVLERLPRPWETLRFLFDSDSRSRWITAMPPVALAVSGIVLLERLRRSPREVAARLRARREARAALLTLVFLLGFTFLDHQAFPDKFPIVPFMSAAAGWVAALAGDFAGAHGARRAALLACAVLYAAGAWQVAVEGRRDIDLLALQRQVAAKVRAPDPENPSVWAVGCLHLLAFNRQSNFASVGALFDARVRAAVGRDYRPLRDGRMPRIILLARLTKKNRPAWLAEEYEERSARELDEEGVTLFVRSSKARPTPAGSCGGEHAGDGA